MYQVAGNRNPVFHYTFLIETSLLAKNELVFDFLLRVKKVWAIFLNSPYNEKEDVNRNSEVTVILQSPVAEKITLTNLRE